MIWEKIKRLYFFVIVIAYYVEIFKKNYNKKYWGHNIWCWFRLRGSSKKRMNPVQVGYDMYAFTRKMMVSMVILTPSVMHSTVIADSSEMLWNAYLKQPSTCFSCSQTLNLCTPCTIFLIFLSESTSSIVKVIKFITIKHWITFYEQYHILWWPWCQTNEQFELRRKRSRRNWKHICII